MLLVAVTPSGPAPMSSPTSLPALVRRVHPAADELEVRVLQHALDRGDTDAAGRPLHDPQGPCHTSRYRKTRTRSTQVYTRRRIGQVTIAVMTANGAEFGVLGPLQMPRRRRVGAAGHAQAAGGACHAGDEPQPARGDRSLIEAAWEQFPPPDPRASLHSYVSNLRKLLAGIGVDSRTALASAPPGYRLDGARKRLRHRAIRRSARPRACRPPPPGSSSRPASTCPRRSPSGAVRSSRTCATSNSSTHSPPRSSRTRCLPIPRSPKPRSPVGVAMP